MATGRLVNQRSEHHADGAEHILYRRIALQAGIMRPTFNPTTSVTQVMSGGERVDANKDNGSPSSLLLMEDYEIGPIHCSQQRWDEESTALNGPSHFIRMSKEMWDIGRRLTTRYEEEKKEKEKESDTATAEEHMETVSHKSATEGEGTYSSLLIDRQRNAEEVSSVATRGSSPSQSVITMETEVASERSVSPTHTAVPGTSSEPRPQPPSRESTPLSHEARDDSRMTEQPADPQPPPNIQELEPASQPTSTQGPSTAGPSGLASSRFDGSVESARTLLASLERSDPMYMFYSALTHPTTTAGPSAVSEPNRLPQHIVGVSTSSSQEMGVSNTSSPSDTLGPLLTSSLTVSTPAHLTTVSACGVQVSSTLARTTGSEGVESEEVLTGTPESTQLYTSQPSPLSQEVVEQQPSDQQGAEQQPPSDQQGVEQQPPSDQQGVEQQPPTDQQGAGQQPPSDQQGVEQQPPSDQQGAEQQPPSDQQRVGQQPPTARGLSSPSLPEVLDPTFLAALPDNIRNEVISQHRVQRQRHNASAPSGEIPEGNRLPGIDPNVLAQLPLEIQAEVTSTQWLLA